MTKEQTMAKTTEELLDDFKAVLLTHGTGISQSDYDKLNVPSKPGASTMKRRTDKSWTELKIFVLGETEDPQKVYLIQQNKKLLKELDKMRQVNRVIIDNCLAAMAKISFRASNIPKREKGGADEQDLFALRSDAHVGAKVDKKWVAGINIYDADTYFKRAWMWAEMLVKFREQDKKSHNLNKLVLNFLGDQITGEKIYPGQTFQLDMYLTDQIFHSIETEVNIVLYLAKHFPEIEVFCVLGNHGRVGRPGEYHYKSNFDYIFYKAFKMALKNQKNVKVFVSESPTMLVQHGNKNFVLNHGDSVKGWAGIPFYGIERQFRKLTGLHNITVDYELMAHFHNPSTLSNQVFINGSLVGGDELSINKMGLNTLPCQKIFYFHKGKGMINRESSIYLDVKRIPEVDTNGIYTHWS